MTKSVLWNFAILGILPFQNNSRDLDPSYKMDLDFWNYFGRSKIRVLPFLNNPKDLDPSYKMNLDFWDYFGRKKTLSYNSVLQLKKYSLYTEYKYMVYTLYTLHQALC